MRTDIVDLHDFYESPLGAMAREFISARLQEAWSDHAQLRMAGFGHAEPYLAGFANAERRLALAPAGQGVIRWPVREANAAALVADYHWPLPDASIDRLIIVHGLEESGDPVRLLREAWRVLTDSGRLIIVASHRRGLWSAVDTTPFAHGRPYLKRQLERLLVESLFRPEAWSSALFFPPAGARFMLRAAMTFERAGARLWPGIGGVTLVEASKEMARPIARAVRAPARIGAPAITAVSRPASSRPISSNSAPSRADTSLAVPLKGWRRD